MTSVCGQSPHRATGRADVEEDYSWRTAGGLWRGCRRSESWSLCVEVEEEEEGQGEGKEEESGKMVFGVEAQEYGEAGR